MFSIFCIWVGDRNMKSLKRGQDLTRFWWVASKWHFAYCVQILPRVIFFVKQLPLHTCLLAFSTLTRAYIPIFGPHARWGFPPLCRAFTRNLISWATAHEPPIFFSVESVDSMWFSFFCVIIIHKNMKTQKRPSSYKSCVGHLIVGVLHYKLWIFIWIV